MAAAEPSLADILDELAAPRPGYLLGRVDVPVGGITAYDVEEADALLSRMIC